MFDLLVLPLGFDDFLGLAFELVADAGDVCFQLLAFQLESAVLLSEGLVFSKGGGSVAISEGLLTLIVNFDPGDKHAD